MTIQTRLISSLEKVFADEDLHARERANGTALRGEIFSYQLACRPTEGGRICADIKVRSELKDAIRLYTVGLVPSMLPAYPWSDENHLRKTPGLYPDPLFPCNGRMNLMEGQWRCLWIEISLAEDISAGCYPVQLCMTDAEHPENELACETFTLEVLDACLPAQTLLHTEWFHCDCLAVHYHVPVFSEDHWALIDRYMANAARYGINMLLTPVLTPPLDTAIGQERPTVQLVDVEIADNQISFRFAKLKRYMDMAWKNGIRYYEISHLFSQWGAGFAPKVVATVDGVEKRIFGWETAATEPAFTKFLRLFLTELKAFLKAEGRLERCYFHISDEPSPEHLESYRQARDSIRDLLEDCHTMDALSSYSFYESGLVPTPIPSNDHIETFLEQGVPDLWTYYCCGQVVDVSNRMMAMPSARSRILGWQLYKYRIVGFLQWGYNFWFNQLSRRAIDPYYVTDAEDAFPSGDAFMVYPGEDGMPVSSLRQVVFYESLQDLRALQLLETKMSHVELVSWLDSECTEPLTFRRYPREAEWILTMREKINRKICERFGEGK